MKNISDRREDSKKWVDEQKLLTPHATKKYSEQEALSHRCEVMRCDATQFYVKYTLSVHQRRRLVDLAAKTCSCLEWQQNEIPCCHAIAAARADGRLTNIAAWYQHALSEVYTVQNYRDSYAGKRVRVPMMDDLEADGCTKPAHHVIQAGRPRKKRIRSRGESEALGQQPIKRPKCSICGLTDGHNRRTCQNKPW